MHDSSDHVYDNNVELLAYKTWLVEQPEYGGCGYVTGANNHGEVSTTLWWARPRTEFQERVLTEARARGTKATIIGAKYSRQDLQRAAMLIFDASDDVAAVDFEITHIKGTNSEHDGLRVVGFDPAHPEPPLDESTRTAVRAVLQGSAPSWISLTSPTFWSRPGHRRCLCRSALIGRSTHTQRQERAVQSASRQ